MVRRSGMSRRSFLRSAGIGAAGLGAAAMGMSGVASAAKPQPGGKLEEILARGRLRVAIDDDPNGKPGFYVEEMGFEADLARALALAIFGEQRGGQSINRKIQWVPVNSVSRFYEVVIGNADVCFRSCTWTGERDTYQGTVTKGGIPYAINSGVAFGPVYYYDGFDILVNGVPGTAVGTVGVQNGSTSEDNLIALGIPYTGYDSKSGRNAAFAAGDVDSIAGDASDVGGLVSLAQSGTAYLYFSYTEGKPKFKEPLAPFVAEGDQNWHDIVTWVMFALFQAWEMEIEGTNWKPGFGIDLGLQPNWAELAVSQGHYADLYYNNLGVMPEGKNKLWLEGGLIYSMAFR